ncbi:MAG: ECF-type sigma factor [Planctomycetota bacterium]
MKDLSPEEVAELINRVREGDNEATTVLWEHYFQPLVRLAASRMPSNLKRMADEEDVALSALNSFIAGVRRDQYSDLSAADNLWGLLITLTTRKVTAHLRQQTRQKRGGGQVRGESVFADGNDVRGSLGQWSDRATGAPGAEQNRSPDLRLELAEACERLLDDLADDQLRQIAVMRMEGYLVDEIASELEMSKRAVERRLQLIRKTWSEESEADALDR